MVRPRCLGIVIFGLVLVGGSAGLPHLTDLFTRGTIGVKVFRVPNLVTTRNGTLLVLAQGKLNGGGDNGATSVLMRRSDDGGSSWQEPMVVLSDPKNTSEFDSVMVYEPTTDVIYLLYQKMDVKHLCDTCVTYTRHSMDYGMTWSTAKALPGNGTTGSAISSGVVLVVGKYRGRLLVPHRHDCHDCSGTTNSFALISDDKGLSWQGGAMLPHGWSECQLAEMRNGSVLITSRNDGDQTRRSNRLFARSDDGGESWAEMWEGPGNLPDSRCAASMVSDPLAGVIYFGNPSSSNSRTNFSVHISRDDGHTWVAHAQCYAGGSAYSDMSLTNDGRLGFVFEKDGYAEISFGVVPIAANIGTKDVAV